MNEQQFYKKSKEIIAWIMEKNPVLATYMGVHQYDDQLADYSLQALQGNNEKIKLFLKRFNKADRGNFSKEGQIDLTLVKSVLKKYIRNFAKERSHLRDPSMYLGEIFEGVMALILKDFAPLSERLVSLVGRIEKIPEIIKQARENLDPEQIPEIWIEVALQTAQMATPLFEKILPEMAGENNAELQEEIAEKGKKAAGVIQEFSNYLQDELKPAAKGKFAAGKDLFDEKLKEEHMVDYDSEELLEKGWQIFEETRQQMEELAEQIDPAKSVKQILNEIKMNYPESDEILSVYQKIMEKTRQFVIDKKICFVPENEKIKIIATPDHLKPIIPFAAYMPPGIYEEELQGLFMVTTVDSDLPEEEKIEKLKGHNYAKIPVTALHEGYPGHHLQLVTSIQKASDVRNAAMNLSSLFIEGWAFYCEELMEEKGFIDLPEQKLSRLSDQLWRAARIILDVSLHCKGMSVAEAVDFLVEECQLERSNALVEARRYTSMPTQPQSYIMGKLEILKIIERYKKENPEIALDELHDNILSAGSLTPRLLAKHLFE